MAACGGFIAVAGRLGLALRLRSTVSTQSMQPLGKFRKVFADYLATNLVEILAFWIAVFIVCVVVGVLK